MKYFIVADVHGFYDQMIEALECAGFDKNDPNHTFISLGDLLDRGTQPRECLEYVLGLERKILVRGNHEDLMDEAIRRAMFCDGDDYNGTTQTGKILTRVNDRFQAAMLMYYNALYNQYVKQLVNYGETKTAIFVHGWIPCAPPKKGAHDYYLPYNGDWREFHTPYWEQARWQNGMEAWSDGVRDEKTIYCGHWTTSWGHAYLHKVGIDIQDPKLTIQDPKLTIQDLQNIHFEPFCDDGIVALDACTAFSNRVNCFVLEEE